MANVVEKFGLRPYRKLDGTPLVGAQNRYTIASSYATAIFQGDLVIPVTGGNIERHTAGNSTSVVGVFNGCFYTDPTTQKPTFSNYYPGICSKTIQLQTQQGILKLESQKLNLMLENLELTHHS
jgi:hypothetical protein